MMRDEMREVPEILLSPASSYDIHKKRLVLSINDFNIYINEYNRPEDDFISDVSGLVDLWAFLSMLDDEYVRKHINDILLCYATVETKDICERLNDRNC